VAEVAGVTCAAAYGDGTRSWLGYDSATTYEDLQIDNVLKRIVVHRAPGVTFAIAPAGRGRLVRELERGWVPPRCDDPSNLDGYVCALADSLEAFVREPERWESLRDRCDSDVLDGEFLVAAGGLVWLISPGFAVARERCGYSAIGSGAAVARGAMHAAIAAGGEGQTVVRRALDAAVAHVTDVDAPIHIVEV
jgi:hypothetical protein